MPKCRNEGHVTNPKGSKVYMSTNTKLQQIQELGEGGAGAFKGTTKPRAFIYLDTDRGKVKKMQKSTPRCKVDIGQGNTTNYI